METLKQLQCPESLIRLSLWGSQSWLQPPFQAAGPAGKQVRGQRLPAPQRPELSYEFTTQDTSSQQNAKKQAGILPNEPKDGWAVNGERL